jgi:hypothetical protein
MTHSKSRSIFFELAGSEQLLPLVADDGAAILNASEA